MLESVLDLSEAVVVSVHSVQAADMPHASQCATIREVRVRAWLCLCA